MEVTCVSFLCGSTELQSRETGMPKLEKNCGGETNLNKHMGWIYQAGCTFGHTPSRDVIGVWWLTAWKTAALNSLIASVSSTESTNMNTKAFSIWRPPTSNFVGVQTGYTPWHWSVSSRKHHILFLNAAEISVPLMNYQGARGVTAHSSHASVHTLD